MPKVTLKAKTSAKTHTEIDWEAVHRRIEESNQKLATQEEMGPAALEQAWTRRSAQIARKIQDEQQGEAIQVAIISLDDELYGLDVRHIFDIREVGHITFVPRVPAWALGVVNWRGRVLSVVDFRGFLGLPANNIRPQTPNSQRLIVVQTGEMEVGFPVDAVFMIETVPVGKIRKEEGEVRGIKPELVDGIFIHDFQGKATGKTQEGQSTIVLLNLPALLADPRLVIREEIL
jgi:purine-binding chemotaxis protein CheW